MQVQSRFRILPRLLPLALATFAACGMAHAGTVEYYAPPANDAFFGLSNGGSVAASYNSSGIFIMDESRVATVISPNSPSAGYSGSPSVSASGRYVAASINGADGTSQAAIYDRNASTWTPLGSLNGAYSAGNGMTQSSLAMNISADGSTVVGASAYSTMAGSQTSSYHGTVWRNGQIYDLTGPTTSGSGRIFSSNANGTMVVGYVNNNDRDSYAVWTWNGSGYSMAPTPTATNPFTGATNQHIQLDAISANGTWVAGGSSRNMGSNSYGTFGNAITFLQPTLWNSVTNTMTVIPYDHVVNTDLSNDLDGSKRLALSNDVDKNAVAYIAGVTNDGLVFGSFSACIDTHCNIGVGNADTFVYSTLTGQSITFDSFMASQGVTLTATQHVWGLYDVASDGSAVSGYVFDSATAQTSGFILHVTAVPEPGQWALMALGLPLLGLGRLRRTGRKEAV